MGRRVFANSRTKARIGFEVSAELTGAFAFDGQIVQSLFFLNLFFSGLWPPYVAAQPGLCQTWSEVPKTGLHTARLIWQRLLYVAVY